MRGDIYNFERRGHSFKIHVRYARGTVEGMKAGLWLAGGYCGVLIAIAGDLDYLAKTIGLPRWSSNSPCSLCRCTKEGPNTYFDNRLGVAGWLFAIWTSQEWRAWPDRTHCALFSMIHLSACNISLDWMHAKYLGADQYIYGSIMYYLCYIFMPGAPIENLQIIWRFMQAYYKRHRIRNRYRQMCKLTMFKRKKDYPKLRGKAVEVKAFGPVLQAFWTAHVSNTSLTHKRITLLLKKNIELDDIIDQYPTRNGNFTIPQPHASTFKTTALQVAQIHKQLNEHFKDIDIKIFNVTSKTHSIMHIALLAEHLHPGLTWCYQGEDYMRVVQRLLQSCVRGNSPAGSVIKATKHYNLGMSMSYKDDNI